MLLGNYSVLNKTAGSWRGGTSAAGGSHTHMRPNYGKNGPLRSSGSHYSPLAAIPNGHLAPSAWMLPEKAGGMSSHNDAAINLLASGQGELGFNIVGSSASTFTVNGVGQLVVSGIGTASMTFATTGTMKVALGGAGSASFSFSASATKRALAYVVGSSSFLVDAAADLNAIGHMQGAVTPFTELSPQNLAAAVWDSLDADYREPGTMGFLMFLATAILRNKQVTDPATGVMTVYDTDGTTVLFTANLYQDVAGTIPYQGQGAERRERLT